MSHPTPWKVAYWRRCLEWHPQSRPYIVDAADETVCEMPQTVGHPGVFDAVAVETAQRIVAAVNLTGSKP